MEELHREAKIVNKMRERAKTRPGIKDLRQTGSKQSTLQEAA